MQVPPKGGSTALACLKGESRCRFQASRQSFLAVLSQIEHIAFGLELPIGRITSWPQNGQVIN